MAVYHKGEWIDKIPEPKKEEAKKPVEMPKATMPTASTPKPTEGKK